MKTALIFGVTGQDGAYLSKLLLKKGYIVHGVKRRSSSLNSFRIDDIYSDALIKKGATKVYSYVTHGVLSGKAVERVNNSSLTKLLITDTIEALDSVQKSNKIDVISISSLLGEAIKRISGEKSVSSLFD